MTRTAVLKTSIDHGWVVPKARGVKIVREIKINSINLPRIREDVVLFIFWESRDRPLNLGK